MTWEEQISRRARRLRFRFGVALLKRFMLQWLGGAWIAAGTLILGVRIFGVELSGAMVSGMAAAAAGAVLAFGLARAFRQLPTREQCLTWLDGNAAGCGGFLVTAGETDLRGWERSLPLPEVPYLEVRSRGGGWIALLAGIYLAGAGFGPVSPSAVEPRLRQDLAGTVPELREKFSLLVQEQLLSADEEQQFRNALAELSGEQAAGNAARLYETLDQLQHRINTLNQDAVSRTRDTLASLDMLEAAAQALGGGAAKIDPTALTEFSDIMRQMTAAPEIAALVQKFGAENPGATALAPEQIAELQARIGGLGNELEARLERLGSAVLEEVPRDGMQSMAEWLADNEVTAPALGAVLARTGGEFPVVRPRAQVIDLAPGMTEKGTQHSRSTVFPQHVACVSRFFEMANE